LKNYISFQRWRKDEKLIVHLQIENIEPGLRIAPLLLVVLIENAFKFVSNFTDKENKICIQIYTKANVLHSTIINTRERYHANVNNNSNGIGITNLKRRLELLYAGRHLLSTKNDHDIYETKLIIDLT